MTYSLVALVIVALVGIPSSLKNWTALVLVWNYIIVTGVYWATGETSTYLNLTVDYMVLVVIFTKAKQLSTPSGALGWAKDWWQELSWWDKAIVLLFLPSWCTYAIAMPYEVAFWIAWPAGIMQILAAGGEAFENWRRGRVKADVDSPTDTPMLRRGLRYEL